MIIVKMRLLFKIMCLVIIVFALCLATLIYMALPGQILHVHHDKNLHYYVYKSGTKVLLCTDPFCQYIESIHNIKNINELSPYTSTMMLSAIYPPKLDTILMLGLGGGGLATYLSRHIKEAKIDVIEIDAYIHELAKSYFNFRNNENVRTIIGYQTTIILTGFTSTLVT